MEDNRMTRILFIWVTLSLTALSHTQKTPKIYNLECFNDFLSTMTCTWEVDSASNCSTEFSLLALRQSYDEQSTCDDLVNEQRDGFILLNQCRCDIRNKHFFLLSGFDIEVASNGETVGRTSMTSARKIKPLAPSKVHVEPQEAQFLVNWTSGYEGNFMDDKLTFQVQILSKQDRVVAKEDTLHQKETYHNIGYEQLKRGEDYIIRVRTMARKKLGFEGTWGEWSPETEWKNDYSFSILDLKKIIIPSVCIMLLFLIIVGYFCITRCRKKWWDNIPDPSKSRLASSKLLQLPSGRKPSANKSCGNYLSRLVKAHKTKREKLAQQPLTKGYVNVIGCSYYQAAVFEPKDEDIENAVELYPIPETEKSPIQEDMVEEKTDDQQFGEDSGFAKMFSDILNDDLLSSRMDTMKKFDTWNLFGTPTLGNTLDKEEEQRSKSSGCRESGYHSYDSDDSRLDIQTSSSTSNCSHQNSLLNCGYKSFVGSIEEAQEVSTLNKPVRFCLDDVSKITMLRENINHPKSILYYNTKPFSPDTNVDNLMPSLCPRPGHVLKTALESKREPTNNNFDCQVSGYKDFDQSVEKKSPKLGCHMAGYKTLDQSVQENGPALGCGESGYKTFDQSVQENGPALGCCMSGYKSFDQSVQICVPTLEIHTSGYQSFDQSVQENGPTLGCDISGNKSFDQSVQRTGPTLEGHMSGYKSFDQSVQENGPSLKCDISGYKSFDQSIKGNGPALGCDISGYKSFDQSVQENGPALGCDVFGYKSFDQALHRTGPTLEGHMSGYKSFDQSVQENCPALGFDMSGYKSFDQSIQENGPSQGCDMCGYKSFDQAVQENGPSLGFDVSGYKSFDQAVQDNGPALGCDMSVCKSFDQAVQEHDPSLGFDVSVCKSFDQAVQEHDPSLGFDVSGYKSFDQALQENGPALGFDMSGYKSFDQAVQENGPTNDCHMSRYKDFDQGGQQGGETSVDHLTGYQSFDQAVQQGGQSSSGHVTGYQSFDHAVQQDGETSVDRGSEYQSFDHAVEQGGQSSSGHVTGYQPFDHAVQQGGQSSSGHVTGYQSFDQAVKQSETSISTEFLEVDSGYKTFESLVSQNSGPSENTDVNDGTEFKCYNLPLVRTFDICEHLKNLENIHRQKVNLDSLQPTITQPGSHCLTNEPTTANKHQNCDAMIDGFENLSYFVPPCQLQNLSQPNLLIQQMDMDKDGNSYMKIGLV